MTVVQSRAFCLKVHGKVENFLVPFADMINHSQPSSKNQEQVQWVYDNDTGCFVLKAVRDVPKGSRVCANYMKMTSNQDCFFTYGFVQQPNRTDKFPIEVEFGPDNVETFRVMIDLDDLATRNFIASCRYLSSDRSASGEILKAATEPEKAEEPKAPERGSFSK